MNADQFDYSTAFSRNIGWVTPSEQATLRSKRVAIAGLGGVGGSHLLTLTRLGIGSFNIADFDTFDLVNFNRQAGASMPTIGLSKTEVLTSRSLEINPQLDLNIFSEGVSRENVDDFLADVDLYVDGLDFFAVSARRIVFATCYRKEIPAITAAPLGMGAALLNFLPGKMSFEEYFQLEGQTEQEQLIRFLLGLSPAMLHNRSLVDPTTIQLAEHRGPSTPMGCELCAGVAGTEALKILLGRGKVAAAPRGLHFDAYQNRLVSTWRPGGNRNPVQRLGLMVARRRLGNMEQSGKQPRSDTSSDNPVRQILDLARWAPSGDNTQPWRFEIVDEHHVVIHGYDTREHCVYDLQGNASQIAIGALLQTITIAASGHGLRADFKRRENVPETTPTFDVTFSADPDIQADALLPHVAKRTVNRRRLSTRPLTSSERSLLEAAANPGYRILWFESFGERLRFARLLFSNGGLRLNLPEAFETHSSIIQWNSRISEDRIPDHAVGLDPLSRQLMHWALGGGWKRVSFLNKYLAGSLIPRMELDFIPGIACAAHFLIIAEAPPESIDDYIDAGRALQRFWLTAALLDLSLQPEMTPLIFDSYVKRNIEFTSHKPSRQLAESLSTRINDIISPESTEQAVFMGRLGAGPVPAARSVRLPLDDLIVNAAPSLQEQ
jgi:molybdopterin/thiamine biosynthesis adenylyltransferase